MKFKIASVSLALFLLLGTLSCTREPGSSAANAEASQKGARIGYVDMETLFHSYSKTADFYKKAEEIQAKFQDIEEDDFEQMMQLQTEFQVVQAGLFQSFQDDIEKTAETVSKDMNLDVIAVEVLYNSGSAELVDATAAFMENEIFGAGGGMLPHVHGPDCDH
jgi:Skp family chaperone for outer membrane proteins